MAVAIDPKRANFERICEARIAKINDEIRKLGNLSNPYTYDYEQSNVDSAIDAVLDALSDVDKKFDAGLRKSAKLKERRVGQKSVHDRFASRR